MGQSNEVTVVQEFIVETRIGKWITNIAGAGFTSLFLGGIPLFTGLANAGWALILEHDLVSYLENTLNRKKVTTIDNIYQPTEERASFSARQKAKQQVKEEFNKLLSCEKCGDSSVLAMGSIIVNVLGIHLKFATLASNYPIFGWSKRG